MTKPPQKQSRVEIAPDAISDEQLDRLAIELARYVADREYQRQGSEVQKDSGAVPPRPGSASSSPNQARGRARKGPRRR
jgi:hypothetical protein